MERIASLLAKLAEGMAEDEFDTVIDTLHANGEQALATLVRCACNSYEDDEGGWWIVLDEQV